MSYTQMCSECWKIIDNEWGKKVRKQDFEAKRMVLMGISFVERRSDLESEDISTNLSSDAYFVTLHRPYKLSILNFFIFTEYDYGVYLTE